MQLRLTPEQNDQKQAAELAVKEAQDELEAETETEKKDALKAEIADRQEKLTSLVTGFEVRICSDLVAVLFLQLYYTCNTPAADTLH